MATPKPPANGKIPARYLAVIPGSSPRIHAEKNAVAAYARLHHEHPATRVTGRAAGYWSRRFDKAVRRNPAKYAVIDKGLAPYMHSAHGLGQRINIHGITPAIAAEYGFHAYNSYTYDYTGKPCWE